MSLSRRFKPAREHFIPKGSIKLTFKNTDAVVYVSEMAGKLYGVGFAGKRQKPDFNFMFRNAQQREKYVSEYVAGRAATVAYKTEQAAKKKGFKHGYEIGDLLSYSWGYDQTNVDFFQVVAKTAATVTIREIGGRTLPSRDGFSSMSGHVAAVKDSFVEKSEPMVKRVQHSEGKGYISMDHGSASITTETESHYCSWYA